MKLSHPKNQAYTIWLLNLIVLAGGTLLGVIHDHPQGRDMSGYATGLGICVSLPLIVIGLPASIVLFIVGVGVDRKARREVAENPPPETHC